MTIIGIATLRLSLRRFGFKVSSTLIPQGRRKTQMLTTTVMIFAFLAGTSVFAQSVSSLSGTVTDSSGALLPGSAVMLRNSATGLTYNAGNG